MSDFHHRSLRMNQMEFLIIGVVWLVMTVYVITVMLWLVQRYRMMLMDIFVYMVAVNAMSHRIHVEPLECYVFRSSFLYGLGIHDLLLFGM